jgi:hypothetical protein
LKEKVTFCRVAFSFSATFLNFAGTAIGCNSYLVKTHSVFTSARRVSMFCDKCGTPLQSGQRFCNRCGKELAGITSIAYPTRGRVAEHVRLVGILWLAWAAFEMVGSAVVYILANTLFLRPGSQLWLHTLMSAIAVLLLVKATAGFAAGWGLLQRELWARLLTLVLAFVNLFNVPFGTALGVYTLWVLLPAESEQEYETESRKMTAA